MEFQFRNVHVQAKNKRLCVNCSTDAVLGLIRVSISQSENKMYVLSHHLTNVYLGFQLIGFQHGVWYLLRLPSE